MNIARHNCFPGNCYSLPGKFVLRNFTGAKFCFIDSRSFAIYTERNFTRKISWDKCQSSREPWDKISSKFRENEGRFLRSLPLLRTIDPSIDHPNARPLGERWECWRLEDRADRRTSGPRMQWLLFSFINVSGNPCWKGKAEVTWCHGVQLFELSSSMSTKWRRYQAMAQRVRALWVV